MVYEIRTKFDVDDVVIGIPTHLPALLKIDRIEISFERFDKKRPEFTSYRTIYLATPVDKELSNKCVQRRYDESELFTKEEFRSFTNTFLNTV